jgi:Carboxypeptidase regulatory-like domain
LANDPLGKMKYFILVCSKQVSLANFLFNHLHYMNKFATLLLASVCAGTMLAGCSGKDGDPGPAGTPGATGPAGPAGPSGQNLTGNLVGFVNPVDEFGNPLAKNGVTVTLDGVTPAATATTNADGRYEFTSLRNGTYNLSFSRTGLGSIRRIGVGHVGGDQPTFLGTNTISAPSTTTIGNVAANSISSNGVTINIPFSNTNAPSGSLLRFAVYASSSPNVTAATGTLLANISNASNSLNFTILKSTLNANGFASGTAVYVVVYGVPAVLTSYSDPTTGRIMYNGLGTASNQVAFIVP